MQYPNVLECAVIGVPDKDRGQAIKAIVKMADGAPHDKELENKIKTFCNKRMASYKWIQHLEIVDEFPKQSAENQENRFKRKSQSIK